MNGCFYYISTAVWNYINRNFISSAVVLYVLFLLFVSCHKEVPEPDPNRIPLWIPPAVKDYMYFKQGTYWIYKEEKSGVEDSVYVYYSVNTLDTITSADNLGYTGIFEWMAFYTHSSLDNSNNMYWVDMTYSFYPNAQVQVFGKFGWGNILFLFPYEINKYYFNYYDTFFVTNYYPSFKTNNIIFPDVVKIYFTKNILEAKNETNYYFSKHYGIIRKELLDSVKTWNLVRNKISQ